jgi:hypothetical protein
MDWLTRDEMSEKCLAVVTLLEVGEGKEQQYLARKQNRDLVC